MFNRRTFTLAALITTALLLTAAHLRFEPVAHAEAVVGRDYQLVTGRVIKGGEGLYILDNRTGYVAIFTPENTGGGIQLRVKDVRPMTELMSPEGARAR